MHRKWGWALAVLRGSHRRTITSKGKKTGTVLRGSHHRTITSKGKKTGTGTGTGNGTGTGTGYRT